LKRLLNCQCLGIEADTIANYGNAPNPIAFVVVLHLLSKIVDHYSKAVLSHRHLRLILLVLGYRFHDTIRADGKIPKYLGFTLQMAPRCSDLLGLG
jgi:hypothetical protein